MLLDFFPRYAADGGASGGDDDPDERVRSEDVISRAKDDKDAIARLGRELDRNEDRRFKLREDRRVLREQVAAAALPEGAVTLSKEDAAAWEAYKALGKRPSELKAELDSAATAATELTTLRQRQTLHDVQSATGFDPDVLGDIGANWAYRIADEQADGKPVKVVYVKEGDQELRIDEHPKVQRYIKALKPEAAPPPAEPRNTLFLQQHGGSGDTGDMAAQFIKKQAEKRAASPNPLMKQGA